LGEPAIPGAPRVTLQTYGVDVPGSTTLSTDSLTLTFTPSAALQSNAVHVVTVTGARDVAGNSMTSSGGGCFITGGAGIQVFADTGPFYQFGTPAGLVPPDVREVRFVRATSTVYGVLQFDAPRTLDPNPANNVSVFMDLDVDQDGATGFVPFKDAVFAGVLAPSGAKSEFLIEIGTLVDGGDAVARYTAQDTAQGSFDADPTALLAPVVCGGALGFAFPIDALGGDDGAFDFTAYVDVFRPDQPNVSGIIDPVPDGGFFSVNLTAAGETGPTASSARRAGPRIVPGRRPGSIRKVWQ
jgi:hypothetical protein